MITDTGDLTVVVIVLYIVCSPNPTSVVIKLSISF